MSDILNKVHQRSKDIAAKVEASLTFDDDGAGVLPETFVKDNLAEGLTIEAVEAVQSEEAYFATGLALGLGNASAKLMGENKGIDRTSASLGFGANTIKASVDRKIMTRAPGSTEEKPKFGNLGVKLESGSAAKRGDLKRVATAINENFTGLFGK